MITSSSGMRYVMVLYEFYSNLIWATTISYKTKLQLVTAYKRLFPLMKWRGLQPQLQRLDNACYKFLKEFMTANNVAHQLKLRRKHSCNYSKKAIQNWKYPFLSGMTSTHPDFPFSQWCKLVEQANITLNILPTPSNPPFYIPLDLLPHIFLHINGTTLTTTSTTSLIM